MTGRSDKEEQEATSERGKERPRNNFKNHNFRGWNSPRMAVCFLGRDTKLETSNQFLLGLSFKVQLNSHEKFKLFNNKKTTQFKSGQRI